MGRKGRHSAPPADGRAATTADLPSPPLLSDAFSNKLSNTPRQRGPQAGRTNGSDSRSNSQNGGVPPGTTGGGHSRQPQSNRAQGHGNQDGGHRTHGSHHGRHVEHAEEQDPADSEADLAAQMELEATAVAAAAASKGFCRCRCIGCWCLLTAFMIALLGPTLFIEGVSKNEQLARQLAMNTYGHVVESLRLEPGYELAAKNVTPLHPVVIVPGIISTALEMWRGKPCAPGFRERLWGETVMLRKILLNPQCWLQHMMLDPITGADPPGIKVRAATGLEAADYVLGGYSVWGPLIENLATIGYDHRSMRLMSYDWRLTYRDLEKRDRYFTEMRRVIELLVDYNGQPVSIVAHSMGGSVCLYFFNWIQSKAVLGPVEGRKWLERHVDQFIPLAASFMGTLKAVASLVSGEMRDTTELNPAMALLKETVLSRLDLQAFMRSFGSVGSLWPVGGSRVWGNATWAPDVARSVWNGPPILLNASCVGSACASETAYSLEDIELLLKRIAPDLYTRLKRDWDWRPFVDNEDPEDDRRWANPLLAPLPKVPSMKVLCLYGTSKSTERGYAYRPIADDGTMIIDASANLADRSVANGVLLGDGDGTVPLISLGYMCVEGWKSPKLNPANISIVTREFAHLNQSSASDRIWQEQLSAMANEVLRHGVIRGSLNHIRSGGGYTADHVDILLNPAVMRDILRSVTGSFNKLKPRVTSPILQWAPLIRESLEARSDIQDQSTLTAASTPEGSADAAAAGKQ